MADFENSAVNELIGQLVVLLMKHGVDPEDAKAQLYILLHDYDIMPKSTDIVPYQGDMNQMLLKKFIVAKKVMGCTDRTLSFYHSSIRIALTKIGKPAPNITSDDILYYLAMEMQRGVSKCTVGNYRRNLGSFFQWLTREEIITKNPMLKVDRIKYTKVKETAFEDEEIERMRTVLRDWREKAMFELLLSTGCRVTELVNIRLVDIDGDAITVLDKGQKFRIVYMNAKAKVAVEHYLAERNDTNPYLFAAGNFMMFLNWKDCRDFGYRNEHGWWKHPELVVNNQPLDASSVRAVLKRAGETCSIENVHPHRFRRTCATKALRAGMTIELVSKMLGHANLTTTQIYLDLTEDDLKQAHKKYVT